MKKDYHNHKDIRLAVKANLAWWSVFFVPLFLLFMELGRLSLPVSLLLATVIAVPLELVLVYAIFTKVNKQNAVYREILLMISREGYAQEVLDKMEQQLQWCKQNSSIYNDYRNKYAMYLADGYQSLHETDMAKSFLDEVDTESLFQNPETITTQRSVALYYSLKIMLLAASGDRIGTKNTLQEMEALFSNLRTDSDTVHYLLDLARYEVHYLDGDYAACAACMEPYREDEEVRATVHMSLARCYWKMGRREEAKDLAAALQPLLKNEWMRRSYELDCKKYLT